VSVGGSGRSSAVEKIGPERDNIANSIKAINETAGRIFCVLMFLWEFWKIIENFCLCLKRGEKIENKVHVRGGETLLVIKFMFTRMSNIG
jgi:hypothetical protein